MAREVDGNLYFLDKYLKEQELAEYTFDGEQSDREEFSGEELIDLVDTLGYKATANLFLEQALEYPSGGFEEAAKVAIRRGKNQELLGDDKYVIQLSGNFYKVVKYWFDTKWLALDGEEGDILERIAQFLSDIVYSTPVVAPEDFVDSIVTVNELIDKLYSLSDADRKVAYQYLKRDRLKALKDGLLKEGITKDYVYNNTPIAIANKILSNTKYEGRNQPRLQVSEELFLKGLDTLGIPKTAGGGIGNEDEAGQVYANVIQAFRQPTNSKTFHNTVKRINKEINERLEKGYSIRFISKYYKDAGLVIYSTEKVFLTVDTNVTLYQRLNQDQPSVVYRKSVHDIRVKDLKQLVSKL